jgi:hypothetical protein
MEVDAAPPAQTVSIQGARPGGKSTDTREAPATSSGGYGLMAMKASAQWPSTPDRENTNSSRIIVKESGAQTRIRTTDTRIFNPLLYQLSYLGPAINPGKVGQSRSHGLIGDRSKRVQRSGAEDHSL